MSNIKILTCYHKPAQLIKSNIIVPIHGGRALMATNPNMSQEEKLWMLDNMVGDDTGDNISDLNPYFCELTILYWAWKNLDKLDNPEYIGLMHYRRFFSFESDNKDHMNVKNNMQEYLLQYKNLDASITKLLLNNDIITPVTSNFPYDEDKLTIKEHYYKYTKLNNPFMENMSSSMFEQVLHLIKENGDTEIDTYLSSKKHYFYNMFIMRTELFKEYCEWMFPILLEIHQQTDYSEFSTEKKRTIGHIAERLTGYFITQLKKSKDQNLKITQLQVTMLQNTNIVVPLRPYYPTTPKGIVFYANEKYIPMLAVAIQSLIENSSSEQFYDIIILHQDPLDIKLIKFMTQKHPNINIRTLDISTFMDNIQFTLDSTTPTHISTDTMLRLFIPYVLEEFEQIVSLDSDLILCNDIQELLNVDLQGNLVGAVKEALVPLVYKDFILYRQFIDKNFTGEIHKYFNAGVLVWNPSKFRDTYSLDDLLIYIKQHASTFADQDVLNVLVKDRVYYLESAWNYASNLPQLLTAPDVKKYYSETFITQHLNIIPKIVHFLGDKKPWGVPSSHLAYLWWAIARKIPFYEQIIYMNTITPSSYSSIHIKDSIKEIIRRICKSQKARYILKTIYYNTKKVLGKTLKHK